MSGEPLARSLIEKYLVQRRQRFAASHGYARGGCRRPATPARMRLRSSGASIIISLMPPIWRRQFHKELERPATRRRQNLFVDEENAARRHVTRTVGPACRTCSRLWV